MEVIAYIFCSEKSMLIQNNMPKIKYLYTKTISDKREKYRQKRNAKIAFWSLSISTITLNINGLKVPFKTERLTCYIKKARSVHMPATE